MNAILLYFMILCFLSLAYCVEGFTPFSHRRHVVAVDSTNPKVVHDAADGKEIYDFESTANEHVDDNALRFRCRVAYDGSNFRGWQVQAQGRTSQVRNI